MKRNLKNILFILIIFNIFFVFFTEKTFAQQEEKKLKYGNYGLDGTISNNTLQTAYRGQGFSDYLVNRLGGITGSILSFVGLLFLVLIIYGGVLWMTAAGNDQQAEKARKVITWSTIGIFMVFVSFMLVQFIGTQATKSIYSSDDQPDIGTSTPDFILELEEGEDNIPGAYSGFDNNHPCIINPDLPECLGLGNEGQLDFLDSIKEEEELYDGYDDCLIFHSMLAGFTNEFIKEICCGVYPSGYDCKK